MFNYQPISYELINYLYENTPTKLDLEGEITDPALCCDAFVHSFIRAIQYTTSLKELSLKQPSHSSAEIIGSALSQSNLPLRLIRLSECSIEPLQILLPTFPNSLKGLMLENMSEKATECLVPCLHQNTLTTLGLINFPIESNRVITRQFPKQIKQLLLSNPAGVSVAGIMQAILNSRVSSILINDFSAQAIRVLVQSLNSNIRKIHIGRLSDEVLDVFYEEFCDLENKPDIRFFGEFSHEQTARFDAFNPVSCRLQKELKRENQDGKESKCKRLRSDTLKKEEYSFSEDSTSWPNAQPSPDTFDLSPITPSAQKSSYFFAPKQDDQEEEAVSLDQRRAEFAL